MPNQVFATAECSLTLRILHSMDSSIIIHLLSRHCALSSPGSCSFILTCNQSASCPGPHPDLIAFVPYIPLLVYLASSLCPTSSPIPSMLITYLPCFIHMSSTYTHMLRTYDSCTCIITTTHLVRLLIHIHHIHYLVAILTFVVCTLHPSIFIYPSFPPGQSCGHHWLAMILSFTTQYFVSPYQMISTHPPLLTTHPGLLTILLSSLESDP